MTKALLIDDSRMARMMLRKVLTGVRDDWSFSEASNGEEALEVVAGEAFEVIFIDVNMPGMSGIEVSKLLKERCPDSVLVLATANIQQSVQDEATKLGISVLGKPVTADKMVPFLEANGL